MANGDPIPAEHIVVRRFNPTDDKHWSSDDEGLPPRLRSSAFSFDPEPTYNVMGCSVFEEAKLIAVGEDRWVTIESERPQFVVATATAKTVRAVTRSNVTPLHHPFDAIEDVDPGPELPGMAHALITHAHELKGASKWYRELALAFDAHLVRSA